MQGNNNCRQGLFWPLTLLVMKLHIFLLSISLCLFKGTDTQSWSPLLQGGVSSFVKLSWRILLNAWSRQRLVLITDLKSSYTDLIEDEIFTTASELKCFHMSCSLTAVEMWKDNKYSMGRCLFVLVGKTPQWWWWWWGGSFDLWPCEVKKGFPHSLDGFRGWSDKNSWRERWRKKMNTLQSSLYW